MINMTLLTVKNKFYSELNRRGIKTGNDFRRHNLRAYLDICGAPSFIKKNDLVEEYPFIMSSCRKSFLYESYLIFSLTPVTISPDGTIEWKQIALEFDSEGNSLTDKPYRERIDDIIDRMVYKMYVKELVKLKECGIMMVKELFESKDENGVPIYYHTEEPNEKVSAGTIQETFR